MKILFVTTRNVATTSGELRLIKSRACAMREHFSIDTHFISYIDRERVRGINADSINTDFETVYVQYSKDNPISYLSNLRLFENSVLEVLQNERDIGVVIISGAVHPRLVNRLKNIRTVKIIVDIHGAIEELMEYQHPKGQFFSRLFYQYLRWIQKKQLSLADGAMVVSESLKQHVISSNPVPKGFRFFIIPCSTKRSRLSIQEYWDNRSVWRDRLGVAEHECLFIYSGGASQWQMVTETIDLYREISSKLSRKSSLLLMSHRIDEIKSQVKGDTTNLIFKKYPHDVVPNVLCAGDFAFLLRDESITNTVAFPNKFLEYVISLNYVIATPFVRSVAELIVKHDCGEIYHGCADDLIRKLEMRMLSPKNVATFDTLLDETGYHNTLVSFKEFVSRTGI